nr:integrase, catalytic region, zinc finger, CCHC-type, peptidase aspartic, catalytic [Tanacetum cinerariifolium]
MFLTHSDEALEIENFKRSRENKIEFAYDYWNLNASYVNEKINFEDNYFQDIINPDFEKIDSLFQQTSSLKPYVLNVILEKIIIDLEDEVVKCDKEENSKLIAPGMFKLNVSQCVSSISMSKSSCDSNNVEIKLKRKRRKRKSSKQNVKQVNNDVSRANSDFVYFSDLDTFSSVRRPKNSDVIWKKKGSSNTPNVGLSAISVSNLNKNVKRYSRKDLLACNNSHLGETTSASVCNDAMHVSCNPRMRDLLDDNNFFIFNDVNVRISPISKMPFRKKPCDSMHVRSNSNSNKSLPKTMHKCLPKLQPLAEPVAKWFPRVKHTFSSVRRPKHTGVIWKKKGSSNTSNVDLSAVSHLKLNKNVKRYSRKDLLSCNNSHLGETSSTYVCNDVINVSCDSRMNDLLDDNSFFIFDDESVRISPVSKIPFRKKPRDSMNVRSKNSGCSKHMTGNRALLTNFVEKFLGIVQFGNNDFAVIAGYGDVVISSMTIKKVYYVEGLGHNLFSVGQFCDKGLEVAFRKSTCFVRNEDGVDLLTSDRSIKNTTSTRKIDRLATSRLIQGLSNDIYSLIDSNETAKDLWDDLERQMRGSEYGEQDRKAAILYEYETFKATEGEQLLDTYLRYLHVINDLKMFGYKKDNLARIKEIIIKEYVAMEDKKMAKQSMDSSLEKLCMEDYLFAYELGVLEDFYFPCVEQPCDDLENANLEIYEPQQCYDEYERMFVVAVILIDNRLVKLIDITLEQWLDLKFRDHIKVDKEIIEGVVATLLIRSYMKQFKEYMEIKRRLEVNGINTNVECDPTIIEFAIWLASKHNDHMLIDCKVPWVDEKAWLEDGIWKEPTNDICHECKPFDFKSGHVEWPLVTREKMDIVMEEIYRE